MDDGIWSKTDFEAPWGIDGLTFLEVLSDHPDRKVLLLAAGRDRYVCRMVGPPRSRNLPVELSLLRHLESVAFPHSPRLVPLTSGALTVPFGEMEAYLLPYTEGEHPPYETATYVRLGGVLARLHAVPGFTAPSHWSFQAVRPAIEKRLQGADVPADVREYFARIPDLDAFPQCVAHSDLHCENVVETADGGLVIIDWDDSGYGSRIMDAALLLLTACMPRGSGFLEGRATAFYRAYSQTIALTAAEREVLFLAGLFWLYAYIDCLYGHDVPTNCRGIQYAIRHRDVIELCALAALTS